MARKHRSEEAREHCSSLVALSCYFILAVSFCVISFFVSVASGEPPLPSIKPSLKPLDLTSAPTTEELMAAGQMGDPLYPTQEIQNKGKEQVFNLSFGTAIQEWNKQEHNKSVTET